MRVCIKCGSDGPFYAARSVRRCKLCVRAAQLERDHARGAKPRAVRVVDGGHWCARCRTYLLPASFTRRSDSPTGLHWLCRSCVGPTPKQMPVDRRARYRRHRVAMRLDARMRYHAARARVLVPARFHRPDMSLMAWFRWWDAREEAVELADLDHAARFGREAVPDPEWLTKPVPVATRPGRALRRSA